MKTLLLSATLAMSASSAFAIGELTCWYDVNGTFTGADSGNWGDAPIGQASPNTRGYGGGAWVFILGPGTWSNGNNCPRLVDISGGHSNVGTPTAPVAPVSPVGTADWGLQPGYGTATLNEGFLPDPYTVQLRAGGPVDIAAQVSGCSGGYVAEAPDFRLNYNAGNYAALTFEATSASDTTLVINDPNGQWHCVDDYDGIDPAVYFAPPVAAGQYDIWVGTFLSNEAPAAILSITEADTPVATAPPLPPTAPNSGVGTADWSLDPNFGTANLTQGFFPDPHVVNLTAGGSVDIGAQVPGCGAGFVSAAPDYRLNFTAGTGTNLTFDATSGADTTLVISDPNGLWFCVDDAIGLDPQVFFSAPVASGQYDIWVGTWQSGSFQNATLSITEF